VYDGRCLDSITNFLIDANNEHKEKCDAK